MLFIVRRITEMHLFLWAFIYQPIRLALYIYIYIYHIINYLICLCKEKLKTIHLIVDIFFLITSVCFLNCSWKHWALHGISSLLNGLTGCVECTIKCKLRYYKLFGLFSQFVGNYRFKAWVIVLKLIYRKCCQNIWISVTASTLSRLMITTLHEMSDTYISFSTTLSFSTIPFVIFNKS